MTGFEDLDLEGFLRAARAPVPSPEKGRDEARARLISSLGPAAFGARPIASSPRLRLGRPRFAWKSPLLLASGFALGVAAHAALGAFSAPAKPPAVHAPSTLPPTPAPQTPSASPVEPMRDVPTVVDVQSLPAAPSAVASPGKAASPSAAREQGDLEAERVLLETARTAIERSDAPHALEAVSRHEKRFPLGQLREERESLRIAALVLAGREDEARAKAAEFHRAFPGSLQGASIDALVSGGL